MINPASTPWLKQARAYLSLLLAATVVGPASAQNSAAQEHAREAKPAEIAPRGQREAKDITYGDWRKLCVKPGGAPMLCRTSITGKFATGQMAVRLDLIERDGDRTARLQVFVPVGMYLQRPAKLTVDQGNSRSLPYTWCLTNTCIAADAADPGFVKDMEAGKALVLEVTDSNLLSLATSLPLAQFASVHNGAPTQTLEQDIEE
ncbi:invasion associated locus B family protein [Bradyrhizobium sp. CSS354]|jgi:invasion protein IalB|uniref:invasion associated locus B family protein n=1 Tax=Bradyrhizobium sp. CSS354 TaxID=2699172 RepID=UPI0023AF2F68|nr:invasion associated locus B family protein [Bradyrhizobium sp. CSS354]MDE5459501.1 invasion associated locus B family protein [Bradyrhizobium sp. CSS354]